MKTQHIDNLRNFNQAQSTAVKNLHHLQVEAAIRHNARINRMNPPIEHQANEDEKDIVRAFLVGAGCFLTFVGMILYFCS